jgi:hypothetical protein
MVVNKEYRLKPVHVFVLLILLFSARISYAQPAETIYLGSIAKIGYINNGMYGPFNIGFNFTFYGNTYSQFFINSNGQINFGTGSDYPENYNIPDATPLDINEFPIPNNFIAPFWDDLTVDASGNILYTTIGAAPNRKLIVQFRNMGFAGGPVYMGTFSVILYEGSGVIQTQYRILVLESLAKAHGESATIGLENEDGSAGALYSYNNPAAIISRQAISFTPSGGNYTIEPNAVYDGVYLTRNLTLPEPGITPLLSPAEDATIGTSHTFEWSASSNAASYSLKLSTNSSLSGATSYDAGSELSYDISGLVPGTTYYWSVFASNATGLTWGEVKKFTVSSSPPLAAVPQTVFVEQSDDKTIKLGYSGGDAGAKTAIITSLPTQGQLYQYNAGVRGASISTVPATVTDAGRNVIYAATGTSGNGVGNFNYIMNDGTGDSPIVLITVNVSPPGIPNLLYAAKSTTIELQFDRPMSDPAGKESEFTVTVDGTPVTVSSLSLKEGDVNSIIVTPDVLLAGGEAVSISYTSGTVTSVQGGWLASFTDQPVTLSAQTIDFSQDLNKKYSDSPFTLTASAPGGSLTYSSLDIAVATVAGSVLTFHALGSSVITAFQAGNATYAPSKYSKTLNVAIGDQTITFPAISPRNVGDADFIPGATSSSGLAVSYSSSNTAVATIISGLIHIVGAGTSVITASQAGNALYNAAPDVQQTLTVADATARTLNLTSVLLEGLYNGSGTMRQAWNESGPQWPAGIADHITVELHSSINYATIVYTAPDIPLSTTGTATVSVPAIYDGTYYITVKHRNSIETTTSVAVIFTNSTINQSFGSPANVYGSNLKNFNDGYFLIYGGDANQNGSVDTGDYTPVVNDVSKYVTGYVATDINGNGSVDTGDYSILVNNASKYIHTYHP